MVCHRVVYLNLTGAIDSLDQEIVKRKRVERQQRLVVGELDHRVKNNLATVLGLLQHTLSASESPADFSETFTSRIHAMARVHEMLADAKWESIDVRRMLEALLNPFLADGEKQVCLEGPCVALPGSGPRLSV